MIAACKALLAGLVALAVTTAPVAAALLGGMPPANMAAAHHDCDRMAAQQDAARAHGMTAIDEDHDSALLHASSNCPGCDPMKGHANCFDGGKCCKLTGVIAALPGIAAPTVTIDHAANPPTLTGRQIRPPPRPPRA